MSNHFNDTKNPTDHISSNIESSSLQKRISYEKIHQSSTPGQVDYSNSPEREHIEQLLGYVARHGGAYGAVEASHDHQDLQIESEREENLERVSKVPSSHKEVIKVNQNQYEKSQFIEVYKQKYTIPENHQDVF